MKFTCRTAHFGRAIGAAERFAGKNITLPILANVLLSADKNGLTMTATNLEHAIEIKIPGDTSQEGKVSVPARIVSGLIQAIHEENIRLEVKQGNLAITSDTRHSRVNGMNADDFPLIPKVKKTASFFASAELLGRALGHVLSAVSSSDFKPELGGVFFNLQRDSIALAATDTFRLAEEVVPLEKAQSESVSFIVPQRACQEFSRLLAEYKDEGVSVSFGDNQILAEIGPVRITSRLIEGVFPEYRAIVPSQFSTSVFIARDELLSAVRSSSIFASKLQEVTLRFSRDGLEVISANPEVGEDRTTLKVAYTGKDASVSFNYRYLLDGIQALEDDEVFFGCNDAAGPTLLRNKSAQTFTYVVMPIRLT